MFSSFALYLFALCFCNCLFVLAAFRTFQFNTKTGDRRISGSLASLAGLEAALAQQDLYEVELAIRRILLLHSMIFVYAGIPVIYMGDELGMLNDNSYLANPDLADDNRWMHRPYMDWDLAADRHNGQSAADRIFQNITHMVKVRKRTLSLHAKAAAYPVWTHNERVFGLIRESSRGRLLALANFSEYLQIVPAYRINEMGFGGLLVNRLDGETIDGSLDIQLEPYRALWLEFENES